MEINEITSKNLPRRRTWGEIKENEDEFAKLLPERNWISADVSGVILDFTKPNSPVNWTLSRDGIGYGKKGDILFYTGKPGSGKTANACIQMAALLKGEYGGIKRELSTDKPPVVLYVDTEQSEDDTILLKNRVCTMAGIDPAANHDFFIIARLRDVEKAADRYRFILKLVYEKRPDVLVIDGALDLVENYNDQEECTPIIRELMKIASKYDMSIWIVLHENPTSTKMVGTIGSIAQRKGTEVFVTILHNKYLEKEKRTGEFERYPDIFYEVRAEKTRGKFIKPWYFEIADEHDWGMPQEITFDAPERSIGTDMNTDTKLRLCLYRAIKKLKWPLSKQKIKDKALNKFGASETRQVVIDTAIEKGYLEDSGAKSGGYPTYYVAVEKMLLTDEVINAFREFFGHNISKKMGELRDYLNRKLGIDNALLTPIIECAVDHKILTFEDMANERYFKFNPNFGNDNELPL